MVEDVIDIGLGRILIFLLALVAVVFPLIACVLMVVER